LFYNQYKVFDKEFSRKIQLSICLVAHAAKLGIFADCTQKIIAWLM